MNFYHEFAVPEADIALLQYLRQTVAHAHARTLQPTVGPVHLNAPFRDPLPPLDDGEAAKLADDAAWDIFFAHLAPEPAAVIHAEVPPFSADVHGVIVAGPAQPADPAAYAEAVGEISRRLGWPVLADGLSPLRNQASRVPGLVTTYAGILRNEAARRARALPRRLADE